MVVFHVTFFDSLHSIGKPLASEIPWPSGPRNCGQVSPAVRIGQAAAKTSATTKPTRIEGRSLQLVEPSRVGRPNESTIIFGRLPRHGATHLARPTLPWIERAPRWP